MNRITLIHALAQSVAPIEAAFAVHWPDARLTNLLDDSLSRDRQLDGELTPAMVARFVTLGRYARDAGAEAVLFTCSAFGPAIDAVAKDLAPLPVHKPNSAMIAAAASAAAGGRIGLLASFAPTLHAMRPEFPDPSAVVTSHCAGALDALAAGDGEQHDAIAAAAAVRDLCGCAVVALAQFSLARAASHVADATGLPVLTTPDCAVLALRADVEGSLSR
jgi:hypothetical protein